MKIKDGFVLRDVAGQAMVIATGEASKDFHGMIRLNQTGRDIWKGLMNGLSEDEIVGRLSKDYEIDRAEAAQDAKVMLEQMREAGFLEP